MSTRKRILKALKECALLSIRPLRRMAVAPGNRSFYESLERLINKGLVARRNESVLGGRAVYYQLAQNLSAREQTARLLGCSAEGLLQPGFRGRDLSHLEHCLVLTATLRQRWPKAVVLCEHEIALSAEAREVLLTDRNDRDLIPDVLVILKSEGKVVLSVAFEIERCRKSDKRIVQKLSQYASQTRLDGLVYFCSDDRLSETIRNLYKARALQSAIRIRHYQNEFLLVGSLGQPQFGSIPKLLNVDLQESSLNGWLCNLLKLKIKKPALSCGFSNDNKNEKNRENKDSPATCYPFTPPLTTPHLHSSNVALHAPVGSGQGRLVQQVAGEKIWNGIGGSGKGSGTGIREETAKRILGSKQILGSEKEGGKNESRNSKKTRTGI